MARGGLAGECERKVTWWLWRAFLSRYRTVYRLPPIAHTPLLLSPPLSSSEGSVTFSRAITLPNDQGNASPFSAFCPPSSSLLEPCVCCVVRAAGAREDRKEVAFCPSFRPLPRSFPLLLCHLIFGRATTLWRHYVKTWAGARSPGNREHPLQLSSTSRGERVRSTTRGVRTSPFASSRTAQSASRGP